MSGNRSIFVDYEVNILWYYSCTKIVSPLYLFEDKRCYKRIPILYEIKLHFVDTFSRRTYFLNKAVPCGSENKHNVVQLNPDEDKYYLLTTYPTIMQPTKKISPESIKATARNPNIDLQPIVIYSNSDIQQHIRTQQYQELTQLYSFIGPNIIRNSSEKNQNQRFDMQLIQKQLDKKENELPKQISKYVDNKNIPQTERKNRK